MRDEKEERKKQAMYTRIYKFMYMCVCTCVHVHVCRSTHVHVVLEVFVLH